MRFIGIVLIIFNINNLNPVNLTLRFLTISIIIRGIRFACLNKWFLYVFILFYVGGIIIIFIYIISLLNTEKFLISFFPIKFICLVGFVVIIIEVFSYNKSRLFLVRIYKALENFRPVFLAVILLVVLITVVKICDLCIGRLKSKINE